MRTLNAIFLSDMFELSQVYKYEKWITSFPKKTYRLNGLIQLKVTVDNFCKKESFVEIISKTFL